MITDAEYLLLKKIHKRKCFSYEELTREEQKTLLVLLKKGLVEPYSKDRADQLKDSEVMLDENAADKSDEAEKNTQPELNPRAPVIYTPAFIRSLLSNAGFFFLLGLLFCFGLKKLFMFF